MCLFRLPPPATISPPMRQENLYDDAAVKIGQNISKLSIEVRQLYDRLCWRVFIMTR